MPEGGVAEIETEGAGVELTVTIAVAVFDCV